MLEKKLTDKQMAAARIFATSPNRSIAEIAEMAGIVERTLYAWKKKAEFMDEVRRIKFAPKPANVDEFLSKLTPNEIKELKRKLSSGQEMAFDSEIVKLKNRLNELNYDERESARERLMWMASRLNREHTPTPGVDANGKITDMKTALRHQIGELEEAIMACRDIYKKNYGPLEPEPIDDEPFAEEDDRGLEDQEYDQDMDFDAVDDVGRYVRR